MSEANYSIGSQHANSDRLPSVTAQPEVSGYYTHYSGADGRYQRFEATQPSTAFRAVAPTYRGNEVVAYLRKLSALADLRANWSSTEAEAPNAMALHGARRVLESLFDFDLSPASVAPSCEGGVVITFVKGKRLASFESLNEGSIVAVISDRKALPQAWTVVGEYGIRRALARFASYLG